MRPDIKTLKKTLMGKKGNYIPIVELGIDISIKEKFLGKKIKSLSDEVEFWYKAGYDYIKLQPITEFMPSTFGIENNDTSINWVAEGKGQITNMEEFESFKFPEIENIDYSRFENINKFLPQGMGVIGQYGDIFTMTWELMGFEKFSFALFENRDLIKRINDKIGNYVLSMFEYFAKSDIVDILWFSDDIAYQTGLMISHADLNEFYFPWLEKIGVLAKKYSKPFITHTDGDLFSVMDQMIDCNVNALHPIEPMAMDIGEVKQKYGNKLCLIGNVDVDLLSNGTVDQIKNNVLSNIEKVGQNGGYCIGSGNSVPNYVNYENYISMIETAKKYGNF